MFALLGLLSVQALRTRPLFALEPLTGLLLGTSALALIALYVRVGQAALQAGGSRPDPV